MNGQRFDDPFVSDGGVTGPFHRPRALVRRFNCRRLTVCSFNRLDRPLSAAILEKKKAAVLRCRWCFIGQIFTRCGHRCLYRTRRVCCWLQLSTDLDDAVRLLCGARVWPRNQSQTVTATWHSDRLEWGLIVENIGLMACYDPSVPLSSARLTDFWSSPAGGTWTTASPPGGTWSFFFRMLTVGNF